MIRLVTLSVLFCCVVNAFANTVNKADEEVLNLYAQQTIQELQSGLIALKQANRLDKHQVRTLVEKTLLKPFDTHYFTYKVLGKNLKQLTSSERNAFTHALTYNLINSYASVLTRYNGQAIYVKKAKFQPSGTIAIVPIILGTENKSQLLTKWRFDSKNTQWKMFDIEVENLSLVNTKQKEIASRIKAVGLLNTLKELEKGNKNNE
ncbi:hypothetical protein C2869_01030 [Saccharobesus litoralis]|uniref:Toluene tolerance protein n=1 Tax=Saccharobesus litoralis TaxID=2172099 RepID=A0A2S0VLM2_9ALTE|nr:ABC transporter substrate-binding protein [Saccharobesus litoralis]AWB65109.1 hypothetical protein C2869_01030 [Saccharobesus litoralis]